MFLALLGGLAARAGGAGVAIGALRVTFWGALAMALTAGMGGCSELWARRANRTPAQSCAVLNRLAEFPVVVATGSATASRRSFQ